jgi:sirohydrochlorin ferrochelatase
MASLLVQALALGLLPAAQRGDWRVLLVDNGSKRPAATLALRKAAAALSAVLGGRDVLPASVAYSDAIPLADLGGRPARTLSTELSAAYDSGEPGVVIAPLFLGPSGALSKGVTGSVASLDPTRRPCDPSVAAPFRVCVGTCLVDDAAPMDTRVARALAAQVLWLARRRRLQPPLKVLVVDHGTPSPRVNAVRGRLAGQVRELLGAWARHVQPASMERREGQAYDFNEPLLERALRTPPFDDGEVVLAMAFLLPGRHAGEGGDVAQIVQSAGEDATRAGRQLSVHTTPLLATHSLVLEVLADRVAAAEAGRAIEITVPSHSADL